MRTRGIEDRFRKGSDRFRYVCLIGVEVYDATEHRRGSRM